MKRFGLFLFTILALASAGCQKEPEGDGEVSQFTIVGTTDGVILPEWKAQEEIMVVCADEVYAFAADKAGKTANFTEAEGLLTAEVIADNPVAAYANCTNMFGSFKIMAEQTWKDGKNTSVIPAYAYTMNAPVANKLALAFKPLASVLNLNVAPYDIVVEKIKIAPAADATVTEGALAGTFTADAAQNNVRVGNALNEVILNLSAPADLKQGGSFNIPLGWFSIEGGLTVTMIYDGVKEYPFTLWTDGVAKSYNDEGGLKSSKLISETLAFDDNAFPRAWFIKADASADAKGLSWETATTLDNALKTALPGSVLHLAAGTYKPTVAQKYMIGDGDAATEAPEQEEFKSFLIDKNISIIGGYPANAATGAVADATSNVTILDGDGKAYHTVLVGAAKVDGEKVVIEGITITGGVNTAEAVGFLPCNGVNFSSSSAGGIALINSAVEMKNVKVTGNKAANNGGLYCAGCDITMTNCSIDNNEAAVNAGGALFTTGTKLVMDGCSISNNTAGGFAGGTYIYLPAGKTMEAEIKNSHIDNNSASSNCGGAYLRDDSGNNGMTLSFTDCSFNYNVGGMGGCMRIDNLKMTFKDCEFKGNQNRGNGNIYILYNPASGTTCDTDITFDGCSYTENVPAEGASSGLIGGIYMYTNAAGTGAFNTYITNCCFTNNKANGRAASLYMRNGKIAQTNLYVANCTFANNTAGDMGTAINLFGTSAYKVVGTVVSSTATGNTSTNATTDIGAFCCETAGTTLNLYNTISAGNKTTDGTACDINNLNNSGAINTISSFIGAKYYGADAAEAAVTPAFDFATMLAAPANGVVKLVGTASTNPAFGNGMTATALKALATGSMSADILAKDQNGNARNDTDKIAGACVK